MHLTIWQYKHCSGRTIHRYKICICTRSVIGKHGPWMWISRGYLQICQALIVGFVFCSSAYIHVALSRQRRHDFSSEKISLPPSAILFYCPGVSHAATRNRNVLRQKNLTVILTKQTEDLRDKFCT